MTRPKILGFIALGFLAVSGITVSVYEWQIEKTDALTDISSDKQNTKNRISNETRIDQLESHLITLQLRLNRIEKSAIRELSGPVTTEAAPIELASNFAVPANHQTATPSHSPSTNGGIQNSLISAGLDPSIAEQIADKENELALSRLDLRDKAMREGYFGTDQYREELSSLNDASTSLREDIGEDYFDRFLYSSGQANRVTIGSVMKGSAAEIAGIKDGDTLLSYGGQRLFQWRELQGKTTTGVKGELTDMTILRDGLEIRLDIPRGPLGVRLSQSRVDPGPS